MTLDEQLLDTWRVNNRINVYLLDGVTPEALKGVPATKGRSVGEMFAHIHNVRLMWLKEAAPDLLATLAKIEKADALDHALLRSSIEASGVAVETMLTTALTLGKVKGFKPHPTAFVGYLISHDSYHRGEICMTLTLAGFKLDQKISYGLWEWGVR